MRFFVSICFNFMVSAPLSFQTFSTTICHWQSQHGRHNLPWQENITPYRVLISEVMLQQTQVATVIPYFHRWMEKFPDLTTLAQAQEDDVMALWQGLGYYQRARRLQKAAIYLIEHHQGNFPNELDELLKIPGVGRYTAGALLSFGMDRYGPIVDGNIKRLFSRYFGIHEAINSSAAEKKLWQIAHDYTPQTNNRQFAQALLDLGATICTATQTACQACPLESSCFAKHKNSVEQLPVKAEKKKKPTKQGYFALVHQNHKILLEKRSQQGIWGALWCLPELSTDNVNNEKEIDTFEHTFSHYKLHAHVIDYKSFEKKRHQQWFSLTEIDNLGIPAPIKKWISQNTFKTTEQ